MLAVAVPFARPLVPATIQRRVTRFSAEVEVDGRAHLAFVPNSGRLGELVRPGMAALLAKAEAPSRRTAFDLVLVCQEMVLVCVDARVPNLLMVRAFRERALPAFADYTRVQPEARYGHSRFDFRLSDDGPDCLVEVKSVTLVHDGTGLFPDAPTRRGRRHVLELAEAVQHRYRAAVVFVVQRADAHRFAPNDATDPAFGQALRQAAAQGVEVYAYGCRVDEQGMRLERELPPCL